MPPPFNRPCRVHPTTQAIRLAAAVCFMHSTANLEASLLVTLVAYRWDLIQHFLFRIHMYENQSPFYAKRE